MSRAGPTCSLLETGSDDLNRKSRSEPGSLQGRGEAGHFHLSMEYQESCRGPEPPSKGWDPFRAANAFVGSQPPGVGASWLWTA